MKYLLAATVFFCMTLVKAQKPCDFTTNLTDSIGKYKTTKEYLLYEKNFAGKASYLFASFVGTDDRSLLQLQLIEKSADFIKIKCFDKNSKIYVQLFDNKIVTLSLAEEESCGTLVRDDKGLNNRILSGYFKIKKEDEAKLQQSPVSFIRIKYANETADFALKKAFRAELNGELYQPESYFVDYLHCMNAKN